MTATVALMHRLRHMVLLKWAHGQYPPWYVLTFVEYVSGRDTNGLEGIIHCLGLIWRDNLVLISMIEDHSPIEALCVIQRASHLVHGLCLQADGNRELTTMDWK